MKQINIFLTIQMRNKCDLFGIGDVIGGLLGFAAADEQNLTQKEINRENIAMQRETNQMQRDMFNENLSFQSSERKDQNRVNWQNAVNMFNMENAYNSPAAQMQRMIAAGLNPAAVSGSPQAGGSSPSVGSSVGSGIPQLTAPHAEMINSPMYGSIGAIQGIADAMGKVSQSHLNEAHKEETLSLLQDKLRNLSLDADAKEIANGLAMKFGDMTKQAEFDLLVAQKAKEMSAISLNNELERTEKEKQLNLISDSLLKDSERLLNKKEYNAFESKLNAYLDSVKADISLKGAQSFEARTKGVANQAQAKLFNEQAATEETVRELNRSMSELNKSRKDLNVVQYDYEKKTLRTRVRQEVAKLRQLGLFNQEMEYKIGIAEQQLEIAEYQNDMKEFTYWSNFAFDLVTQATNMVNAFKGLPAVPWTHDAKMHDSFEVTEDNNRIVLDAHGEPVNLKSRTTKKRYK